MIIAQKLPEVAREYPRALSDQSTVAQPTVVRESTRALTDQNTVVREYPRASEDQPTVAQATVVREYPRASVDQETVDQPTVVRESTRALLDQPTVVRESTRASGDQATVVREYPRASEDQNTVVRESTRAPQSPSPAAPDSPRTPSRFRMDHAYWGPTYTDTAIAALLRTRGFSVPHSGAEDSVPVSQRAETTATPAGAVAAQVDPTEFQLTDFRSNPADLCRETARAISEGLVVGWFQGRLEWGPRALGNRSIVCDPRRADMKDILNQKIKRRESFRPFAPSILREQVGEWFESDADVPFMMQVFQFRAEKRQLLPAVCHVDGSGRLQTVDRTSNPMYYDLITAFREITGVPMVLNTSFNENEPVVCRPEEALDCFLRTKMDLLVLGSFLIRRRSR